MFWTLFIIAAIAFVIYAVYANYSRTPSEKSVPARVWTSVVLAVGTFAAYIAAAINQGGVPQ